MITKVYFGRPGLKDKLKDKGIVAETQIDTASTATLITEKLFREIYSIDKAYEYDIVKIRTAGGFHELKRIYLDIGTETENGNFISAQLGCIISDSLEMPIIGKDFLSVLDLLVTFDYRNKIVSIKKYSWESFEDEVAAIYRALGGKVKQNVNLSGFQVDMVIEETTPSNQKIKIAVECKFYKDKIGNRIVNEFSRIIATLKNNGLIDKGVIISSSGFTQDASLVAENSGIELLTIDDLKQAASKSNITLPKVYDIKKEIKQEKEVVFNKNPIGFVIMPFANDYDDIYHLGIREIINEIGASCERADEMKYVGGIIQKIQHSIKSSDFIIAEISEHNPNVYYEVGFAHAINKPVILLTRNIENTPFDLRSYNHIIYSNIVELRRKLKEMLVNILKDKK